LFVACNKEGELLSTKEGELEYVTVNIDVTASDCKPMTGVVSTSTKSLQTDDIICDAILPDTDTSTNTKSIDDPSDASLTTIKNLWVLQYDGTGNSAKLIGNPVYIEDYQNNKSAKLVASTTPNTIVFLANTFDKYIPFGQNSTIAELKERVFVTNSLETILSKDPNTQTVLGDEFPIDGDYYQRLNGYIEQAITGGTLSCTLAHNACRISLNIVNNTNGPGKANPVTLISADIENVPGCMYFFTDYSGYTSGNTVGKPQVLDGFARYGMKTYTDVITWNGTEGTDPTIIKQAKLYLSANESGVISTNESPKLKSLVAPNSATILRIYGTYNDGTADIPLKYTFALGADMTRSYQLVPNGDYVYNRDCRKILKNFITN